MIQQNKKKTKDGNLLSNSFKWRHYEGKIIILNVRWYLKYPQSYRNLKEMMIEREIQVDHVRYLRPTNDPQRVDETYIKVKGEWKYLYRAIDSDGDTLDFMLKYKTGQKSRKEIL